MKTDSVLGLKVSEMLLKKGIETPMVNPQAGPGWLTNTHRSTEIALLFKKIMEELQLDLKDDSLCGTPERVARMFTEEIYSGLDYANFPKITTIQNKMGYDEMLVEKAVAVRSSCEHHFVVIDGIATVAYVPNKKVIGLSKINRLVNFFARRPQVQERLTEQIHATLCYILETPNVAVVVDAVHFCVKHRGITDANSSTITSKLGGVFRTNDSARAEFLNLSRST